MRHKDGPERARVRDEMLSLVTPMIGRLAVIVRRTTGTAAGLDDLTQAALLEVIGKFDAFDPSRGGFATFVAMHARNALFVQAMTFHSRQVHLKVTENNLIAYKQGRRMLRFVEENHPDLGRDQHISLAAANLGIPEDCLRRVLSQLFQLDHSLDADATRGNTRLAWPNDHKLALCAQPLPDELASAELDHLSLSKKLDAAMASLPERDRAMLRLRWLTKTIHASP